MGDKMNIVVMIIGLFVTLLGTYGAVVAKRIAKVAQDNLSANQHLILVGLAKAGYAASEYVANLTPTELDNKANKALKAIVEELEKNPPKNRTNGKEEIAVAVAKQELPTMSDEDERQLRLMLRSMAVTDKVRTIKRQAQIGQSSSLRLDNNLPVSRKSGGVVVPPSHNDKLGD